MAFNKIDERPDLVTSNKEQALAAIIADMAIAAFLLRAGIIVAANQAAADRIGKNSPMSLPGTDFLACIATADQAVLSGALNRTGDCPGVTTLTLACFGGDDSVAALTLIGAWEDEPQLILVLAAHPGEAPCAFGRDWRFLRQVIDTSSAMIFVKDRMGRLLLANRSLAKAYDLPVEEVEGRLNASLHSNPEEIEAFLRDDREVMDTRRSKLIVAEPVTYSDGTVHWYSTVKTPLLLDSVHCDHVLGIATNIDELKRAEEELQQREHLLRSIIDNATAVIFVKDLGGCYLRFNRRFAELFHVGNESLPGLTDYDLFPERIADTLSAADKQVLAAGVALEFEEIVPQDDGPHTYLVIKFPLRTSGGRAYATCGIATDITERKRIQRQMERHMAEQKAILDNELVGIVTVKDRVILWANPAFEKILGYAPGELNGVPTRRTYLNEEAYQALGAAAYPVIESGGIFRTRTELVRKDGSRIWVDMSGAILDRNNGETLWGFVDITERKKAEQELRARESEFSAFFHSSAYGAAMTDLAGHFLRVNETYCKITGYTAEELLQMNSAALIHPDDLRPTGEALSEYLNNQSGPTYRHENRYLRKDGQVIWVQVNAALVCGASGQPQYSAGTIHDITARKLDEERLQAAIAEAERANNAKSRFLAAASHDLRQPLAALSSYADVLTYKVGPAQQALVGRINACISNMSGLLNNLLDLSKLEAGVIKPDISDFSVFELLANLESVYAVEAQAKGLRLRFPPTRLTGRSDPVLYKRLVGNLIENAIRYTECGGIVVGCRRRRGKTWVEVRDSGIGIAADQTAEIFEEFKQLGDQARNQGSGLGLAIVARTAALLGLEYNVRSQPGRGSVFAIELPLGQPEAILTTESEVVPNRRLRIALVEDNPLVREAMVFALQERGHQVIAAASGGALHAALDSLPLNILISDYRLAHGETGFDVICAMRQARGADMPAILITGDTDPRLIAHMNGRGIAVLHKPLTMDVLLACLDEQTSVRPGQSS